MMAELAAWWQGLEPLEAFVVAFASGAILALLFSGSGE